MPFYESLEEFIERRACKYVRTDSGWFFEDGAFSNGSHHYEPPSDEFELARQRKIFFKTKLDDEITAFNRFKANVAAQANHYRRFGGSVMPPPADAADQLKAGGKRIHKLQEQLAELDEVLQQSPEVLRRQKNQEADARRQEEMASFESEIGSIRI